jgi:hypothetical protein
MQGRVYGLMENNNRWEKEKLSEDTLDRARDPDQYL